MTLQHLADRNIGMDTYRTDTPGMWALQISHSSPRLAQIPQAQPTADEVLVHIELAGICRTDIEVAQGIIPVDHGRIIGHECAGRICPQPKLETSGFAAGARVAINPIIACNNCSACHAGQPQRCLHASMLGIDRDGAFSEYCSIPLTALYAVPDHLSEQQIAYIEPIAATMGVLPVLAELGHKEVALCGSGRITRLCQRVLEAAGYQATVLAAQAKAHAYPVIIDCSGKAEQLEQACRCAAPGGTLIVKSRWHQPSRLTLLPIVQKELHIRGAHYGSFTMAIDWLGSGRLMVDDFFGQIYPLSQWQQALNCQEEAKVFLKPGL